MTAGHPPGRKRLLDRPGLRRSVFWKVAGVLIGVQVVTGLLAVLLTARLGYDRSLRLVASSLHFQLDRLAEEVEQRAAPLTRGLGELPLPLQLDLTARFPDPVILLDADGRPLRTLPPDAAIFGAEGGPPAEAPPLPEQLPELLRQGEVVIQAGAGGAGGTWGLAPVYDPDGVLVGGLLVQPLTRSIDLELADTRTAYRRALWLVAALAGLAALLLGAVFTRRLVAPLQRITRRVESLGAGDYTARIAVDTDDEFGRLAAAVNQMAADVEKSVEALRATDRLRRDLIANIGHDLRTPLAAMMGYVEEAARHHEGGRPGAATEALTLAGRQGAYLERLVQDLFELALLDSAPAPLRREPVLLAELLTEAARAHRADFKEASISLAVSLPPQLPVIEADGVRLLRVMDNLLTNARRHTEPGGTVQIGAAVDALHVRIYVRDSGSGMPPAVLTQIFDRYYRGRDARTRHSQGTGLGLPISRAIARAHGGELSAESTPGAGSTFTLTLPLAYVEDPHLPPE